MTQSAAAAFRALTTMPSRSPDETALDAFANRTERERPPDLIPPSFVNCLRRLLQDAPSGRVRAMSARVRPHSMQVGILAPNAQPFLRRPIGNQEQPRSLPTG